MHSFGWQKIGWGLLGLTPLMLTKVASACPSCATSQDNSGMFYWVLAGMVLLPYPVVAAVIYVFRQGERRRRKMLSEVQASS